MNFSYTFLSSVVSYELIVLTLIFFMTAGTQYVYLRRLRLQQEEKRALEHCVLYSLTQKIPDELPFFTIHVLLDTLISFDERLKGREWELLKERLITPHVGALKRYATTSSWKKRAYFIKGALLAPHLFEQEKVIAALQDKKAVLRYMSAQVLAKRSDSTTLNILLDAIAHEQGYMKHTLRDALLKSPPEVFEMIAEIFRKESNIFRQIACLEVLSQKAGVLRFEDVEPHLRSPNVQLRWWALKALENMPGKETCAVLQEHADMDNADIRCVVASALGNFSLQDVQEKLEYLLTDAHWLVRLNSALSLKRYGSAGQAILEKHRQETNKTVQETVQYALDMKSSTYSRSMLRWLEARAIR